MDGGKKKRNFNSTQVTLWKHSSYSNPQEIILTLKHSCPFTLWK